MILVRKRIVEIRLVLLDGWCKQHVRGNDGVACRSSWVATSVTGRVRTEGLQDIVDCNRVGVLDGYCTEEHFASWAFHLGAFVSGIRSALPV